MHTEINAEPTRYTSLNTDKKFLFLFDYDVKSLAVNCCCGCPLRLGVQILAILFLLASFFDLIFALSQDNAIDIVISLLIVAVYGTLGIMLFLSVLYKNVNQAYIGYFIYTLMFYYRITETVIIFIMVAFGSRTLRIGEVKFEYSGRFALLVALLYLFIAVNILLVQLYCIFIIFSYLVHLENGNHDLISGYILGFVQEGGDAGRGAVNVGNSGITSNTGTTPGIKGNNAAINVGVTGTSTGNTGITVENRGNNNL